MKKLIVSAIAAMTFATQSSAILGLIDIKAGGGGWMPTPTATVAAGAISLNESATSMNLSGQGMVTDYYYYADINHFIPIVPNVRYKHQELKFSGTNASATLGTLTLGDTFTLDINGSLNTAFDLRQDDFILYWNVPLTNLISAILPLVDFSLEFGVDVKLLSGSIAMDIAGTGTQTVDLSIPGIGGIPLPMGYLAASLDLPLLPSIYGEYKTLGFTTDWEIRVDYVLPLPIPFIDFAVEVGYKEQMINLDTTELASIPVVGDFASAISGQLLFENKGFFAGLNVAF